MNVQSHLFVLAYLPVTVILWRLLSRRGGSRAARAVLLGAGALFCGWGSPPALLVLLAEGAASDWLGRRLAKDPGHKKALLGLGAGFLLAVLAFF